MLERILSDLQARWSTFTYNYRWSDYVSLFDGWIARCAMAIPIVGYLILFNDFVVGHLSFDLLAKEKNLDFGLSSGARLKLVYFGLLVLGSANILYRARRPFVMKMGRTQNEYINRALERFVLYDYVRIDETINIEGHRSLYGKYYTSEFEDFKSMARGVHGLSDSETVRSDWNGAKLKYEQLLRSMLMDFYFRNESQRRISLTICICLALFGYALLFIPSADLFIKVVAITF